MDIKKTEYGVCIDGFSAAGVKEGKYGVALIAAKEPCAVAGVFTKNEMKAAPVLLTKEKIRKGALQAIIANSGNANACVKEGMEDAMEMCKIAADELGIDYGRIAVASTGIIGRRLDINKVEDLARKAAFQMAATPQATIDATKAIMTTDTKEKYLSFEYKGIHVGGICKGSGMINPNMATMLCFLTTNADLPPAVLRDCLKRAASETFNMLVVDGCMSTNDMVLLMSSRKTRCKKDVFQMLLNHITRELARLMALDGEGATKFLEVEVSGAKNKKTAMLAAKAIVSSDLVKTAMFGENPNWGRIAGAMGSVIKFDFNRIDLSFESDNVRAPLVIKGAMQDLAPARAVLKKRDIKVLVNLNSGKEKAAAWGCDLSYDYVKINAEYN
jgi:glutamate N-acetyltransferase/amino-acid N-acetyltransferase